MLSSILTSTHSHGSLGERLGVPGLRLPRTPVAPQAGAIGLTVYLPRPRGARARQVSQYLGGLMAMPLIGRWLAAVVGGLLVLAVWGSVIGTLIVPRPVGSWLTRWVDRLVNGAFSLVTAAIAEYPRRDRVLARQAPAIL